MNESKERDKEFTFNEGVLSADADRRHGNTLRLNLHFYENFHDFADHVVQKEYLHFVSDKDCLYGSLVGVFILTDVECDGAFVRRFMNVESQESNRNCYLAHVQPTVSLRSS